MLCFVDSYSYRYQETRVLISRNHETCAQLCHFASEVGSRLSCLLLASYQVLNIQPNIALDLINCCGEVCSFLPKD